MLITSARTHPVARGKKLGTNQPPVWQSVPAPSFTLGTAANFPASGTYQSNGYVTDADGTTLTITWGGTISGVTWDGTKFVYDGVGAASTTTAQTLTASDGTDSVVSSEFTVTVVSDLAWTSVPTVTFTEGVNSSISLGSYVSNYSASTDEFILVGSQSWLTLTGTGGVLLTADGTQVDSNDFTGLNIGVHRSGGSYVYTGAIAVNVTAAGVSWWEVASTVALDEAGATAMNSSIKHTRWARRPSDGRYYNLGGDFTSPASVDRVTGCTPEEDLSGSFVDGNNRLWSYDPTTNDWDLEYPYHGPSGVQLARPDEYAWAYDSTRDRFWAVGGFSFMNQAGQPVPPAVGVAQYFYNEPGYFTPSTGLWTHVSGATNLPSAGTFAQLKYGVYDPNTDKIYMPVGDGAVYIYNCATNTYTNQTLSIPEGFTASWEFAMIDVTRRRIYVTDQAYQNVNRYWRIHQINIDTMAVSTLAVLPWRGSSYFGSVPVYLESRAEILVWGPSYHPESFDDVGEIDAFNIYPRSCLVNVDTGLVLPGEESPPRPTNDNLSSEPYVPNAALWNPSESKLTVFGTIWSGTPWPENAKVLLATTPAKPSWWLNLALNAWYSLGTDSVYANADFTHVKNAGLRGAGSGTGTSVGFGSPLGIAAYSGGALRRSGSVLLVHGGGGAGAWAGNNVDGFRLEAESPGWANYVPPTSASSATIWANSMTTYPLADLTGTPCTVNTTSNTIEIASHGASNGWGVSFYSTTRPWPEPFESLYTGTGQYMFFIVNKTTNDFQLSATIGGAALDITSAGTAGMKITAGRVDHAYLKNGAPNAPHAYRDLQFIDQADQIVRFGSANLWEFDNGKFQYVDWARWHEFEWKSTYKEDGVESAWPSSFYPKIPGTRGGDDMPRAKHPTTEDMYCYANATVQKWTRSTNSWSQISTATQTYQLGAWAIDSTRGLLLSLSSSGGGFAFGLMNLSTGAWTTGTVTGTLPSAFDGAWGGSGCGLVWVPDLDAWLACPDDGYLYRLTYVSGTSITSTRMTLSGTPPTIGASTENRGSAPGIWSRFQYVPNLKGVVLMSTTSLPVYFVKFAS